LSAKEVEAELPAWSVQVTPGAALALSGPLYVVELGQLAIPEVESLPCQVTVTELLYQPFAFGFRSGLGAKTGGSASILINFVVTAVVPPAPVAVHVRVVPVVGPSTLTAGSQPLVEVSVGSFTVQ
jgi:hypothetical protein